MGIYEAEKFRKNLKKIFIPKIKGFRNIFNSHIFIPGIVNF